MGQLLLQGKNALNRVFVADLNVDQNCKDSSTSEMESGPDSWSGNELNIAEIGDSDNNDEWMDRATVLFEWKAVLLTWKRVFITC